MTGIDSSVVTVGQASIDVGKGLSGQVHSLFVELQRFFKSSELWDGILLFFDPPISLFFHCIWLLTWNIWRTVLFLLDLICDKISKIKFVQKKEVVVLLLLTFCIILILGN
jgi:hypothetical protein